MNKYIKLATALAATALYCLILRYVAPSREPYFMLGIGLIGYVSWLYGAPAGLVAALLLVPLTHLIYSQFEISTSYGTVASSPPFIGVEILVVAASGHLRHRTMLLEEQAATLAQTNENLQAALSEVKELGGIHSICSTCHNIMADNGEWMKADDFLDKETKMEFSHAICPNCISEYKE